MPSLEDFIGPEASEGVVQKPVGVEWFASVRCQTCNESVDEQTLYPTEQALVWTCSQGHRSFIESYTAF